MGEHSGVIICDMACSARSKETINKITMLPTRKYLEQLFSVDTKLRLSFDFLDPDKYVNEQTRGGEMYGNELIHEQEVKMITKYWEGLVFRKARPN